MKKILEENVKIALLDANRPCPNCGKISFTKKDIGDNEVRFICKCGDTLARVVINE